MKNKKTPSVYRSGLRLVTALLLKSHINEALMCLLCNRMQNMFLYLQYITNLKCILFLNRLRDFYRSRTSGLCDPVGFEWKKKLSNIFSELSVFDPFLHLIIFLSSTLYYHPCLTSLVCFSFPLPSISQSFLPLVIV